MKVLLLPETVSRLEVVAQDLMARTPGARFSVNSLVRDAISMLLRHLESEEKMLCHDGTQCIRAEQHPECSRCPVVTNGKSSVEEEGWL